MDQCTHEVRAESWKGIIKACSLRLLFALVKIEGLLLYGTEYARLVALEFQGKIV